MSIRCKVCNSTKVKDSNLKNSDTNWECQTCGNILDINGHIVTAN